MSIEKTYQKKTQLEHILLRSDTYIGTIDKISEKMWVFDDSKDKFENKDILYVPGLYKIFDEILVNAVDNFYRDKSQKNIKVTINPSKNQISVYNDGKGIPIVIHKEHKVYVPELIFGHLLTSSNYNDDEKRIIGGRNGYGAKLTNIFSSKFIIETVDLKNKKYYIQEFNNNMSIINPPKIVDINSSNINEYKSDYTKVTFEPDLKKFKMKNLDNDIVSLMKKRVYDIAGTTPYSLNVHYNNKLIANIKDFETYVNLYIGKEDMFDKDQEIEYPKIYDYPNERWEVMLTMSSDGFQQVSFVNNICTSKGGTHVNYVVDKISQDLLEYINKKNKNMNIKAPQIKNHLFVFINCKIENPTFNSQTKETMTLKADSFGSECDLSNKFFNKVYKSLIITNIVSNVKAKEAVKLNKALSSNIKKASRLLGINKLEDANNAGTRYSNLCTLILTEGDSAKSLAMSGIEVVGRENFGVFPLKGKLLNVRDASQKVLLANEEIQNIIKILGLQVGKDYSNEQAVKTLRYGNVMIMADQDPDGSHIKGLLINFIDFFWPSLIKTNFFLNEFITPIVKVTFPNQTLQDNNFLNLVLKDKLSLFQSNDNNNIFNFYSTNDFKVFYDKIKQLSLNNQSFNNITNKLKIKYYKGLGTSTSKEAKEYFKNFLKSNISFIYKSEEDRKKIDLVFNKGKADERKQWISKINLTDTIDYSSNNNKITYSEFIDKELVFFSYLDNARSIPSAIDGLKPSERKILFSCFKRKLNSEIKVAQLSGYVSEHSAYHHGEMSLNLTITAMAQDYIGSNNFNLLVPVGQFGSRYHGIKGAASPRYIFTYLNKLTRLMFSENDDNILTYQVEEGQKIEPSYYLPVLPLLLINGAEGIGTGWSTSIPCFDPVDIANNLLGRLNSTNNNYEFKKMKPWYKGFKGTIEEKNTDNDKVNGTKNLLKKTKTLKTKNQNEDKTNTNVDDNNDNTYLDIDMSNNINNKTNNKSEIINSYYVNGLLKMIPEDLAVEITELPIKTTITSYKEFLEKNHAFNKDNTSKDLEITDIKEFHEENNIFFKIFLTENSYKKLENLNYYDKLKLLKLSSTVNLTNMVAFDADNKIKKYNSPNEILEEFYCKRLEMYNNRKIHNIRKLEHQYDVVKNKLLFIQCVLKGDIVFLNKKKDEIIRQIKAKDILSDNEIKNKHKLALQSITTDIVTENNELNNEIANNEDSDNFVKSSNNKNKTTINNTKDNKFISNIKDSNSSNSNYNYDYLMSMSMWTLTQEKVDNLQLQANELKTSIDKLQNTSINELWIDDINKFIEEYNLITDNVYKNLKEKEKLAVVKSNQVKLNNKGKINENKDLNKTNNKITKKNISNKLKDESDNESQSNKIIIKNNKKSTKPVKKTKKVNSNKSKKKEENSFISYTESNDEDIDYSDYISESEDAFEAANLKKKLIINNKKELNSSIKIAANNKNNNLLGKKKVKQEKTKLKQSKINFIKQNNSKIIIESDED